MRRLTIFLLTFGLLTCKSHLQNNQPKDLNEAIEYFETSWSKIEKENFKALPENEAVTNSHFGVGLWIRNNWIHGNRDTSLISYFHKLGIFHPDDISSIILTSLHRDLNKTEIGLPAQVESYKAYWKPIIENDEKERKLALEIFNNYKIGDPIIILMEVDTSDGMTNARPFVMSEVFDPDSDIKISGIIKDKFNINEKDNVFFKVQITKLNLDNTPILMKSVQVGDIMDFSLRGITISK
jgi:hypothetical protein